MSLFFNLIKKYGLTLLVAFFATLLLVIIYSDSILRLNEVLFCASGDGVKNYFNIIYHVKHGVSYTEFSGMNYPYGELIFLMDIHVLLTSFLKFFSTNIYDVSDYIVGILNACMLLSVPISAIFLYHILQYYNCSIPSSIIASLGISFLCSTAALWMFGHYGLSYVCFFPIGWYLLIKYLRTSKKFHYSILILLNTLFWFYSHYYLGLILLIFNTLVLVFNSFYIKKGIKSFVYFFIQVILPVLVVYSIIKILDNHIGRIELPYLTEHRASISSIFLPNFSPFKPLYELFFDYSHLESELWSRVGNYVGITTWFTLIFLVGYSLSIIWRKKTINAFTKLPNEWALFLLSACLLLSFSFAFPFRYDLEFLIPSAIRQFSGLGRFAWAFYFVITVFSIVFLTRVIPKKWSQYITILAGALFLIEGLYSHNEISKHIGLHASPFNRTIFNDTPNATTSPINFSSYQAIIPIPFYHGYASLGQFKDDEKVKTLSMQLSVFTGIPLMSAILSRNSVTEAKQITQIFAPTFFDKPIKDQLSKKPFLVMYSRNESTPIEMQFLEKARLIYSNTDYELYEISFSDVFEDHTKTLIADLKEKTTTYQLDSMFNFYKSENSSIAYESYDSLKTDFQYRGSGAFKKNKSEFGVVYDGQLTKLEIDIPYKISFWYYNDRYDQFFNTVWLEVKNKNNEILRVEYNNPCLTSIYDGNWAYNEMNFILESDDEYIMLCSQGANEYADTVYFDEILIHPEESELLKVLENEINWKNYTLKR
tara:strand:+ start:2420 stop:4714 length:2295 start_codon:yes stop_codon:yes gene_type:complete